MKMLQEFKNAKGTLSLWFPAMSPHRVPTTQLSSSLLPKKGFEGHLYCASLSGCWTSGLSGDLSSGALRSGAVRGSSPFPDS